MSYGKSVPFFLALLTAACGSSPSAVDAGPCPAFPAAALQTVASQSGSLLIAVRTLPDQPPGRGVDTVQYALTDSGGQPATGLQLAVVPWMPAMAHGTSVNPSITECGGGEYTLSNVDFYMPGTWQLQTSLRKPTGSTDNANPEFQIP